ncbi:MAG TPA: ABC transporter permease subunit [Paenibacillus sp.]
MAKHAASLGYDAGRIDGANEWRIFTRIMVPIIKPGIGALFILNFVQVWKDLNPNFAYKMAGATIAAIPMLLVFMLFQRFFTNGITAGAVKE